MLWFSRWGAEVYLSPKFSEVPLVRGILKSACGSAHGSLFKSSSSEVPPGLRWDYMSAFLFIFNYLCIGVCIFIRWFWGGHLQNEFRESLITTQLIPHLKKKIHTKKKKKKQPQQKITSVVENVEKLRNLVCCSWNCGRVQPLRKTVWRFLKKSDIKLPYDQASLASQRLRLCASTAGGAWVPSLVGEVPDTAWHSQKKKKNLLPYDPAILLLGRHPMNWKKGHKEWKGQSLCSTL